MDYINSLLSSDRNISDVFKENTVAGCSDWTRSTASEAQSLPPSAVQHHLSPFNGTNVLLSEDPVILAPLQDNVKDQTVFQMLTEPNTERQTDRNASVQETLHLNLQEFGQEIDGNLKNETLYVGELDTDTHSNGLSLKNYKSHHASLPHTVKHDPETLVDAEENTVVGPTTEKYTNVGTIKMDFDIPNDSQRTRSDCDKRTNLKESPKIGQLEENNVNKNKKRHRKQTIATKLDEKRLKYQPGETRRKSAQATKLEARDQETDLSKMNAKRVELQKVAEKASSATEARRASLRQHIRKIREEHLDDEFERRLKTDRRVGKQRTTKTERDGARAYEKTAKLVGRRRSRGFSAQDISASTNNEERREQNSTIIDA